MPTRQQRRRLWFALRLCSRPIWHEAGCSMGARSRPKTKFLGARQASGQSFSLPSPAAFAHLTASKWLSRVGSSQSSSTGSAR